MIVVGTERDCGLCGQRILYTVSSSSHVPIWVHINPRLTNYRKPECVWIATPEEVDA